VLLAVLDLKGRAFRRQARLVKAVQAGQRRSKQATRSQEVDDHLLLECLKNLLLALQLLLLPRPAPARVQRAGLWGGTARAARRPGARGTSWRVRLINTQSWQSTRKVNIAPNVMSACPRRAAPALSCALGTSTGTAPGRGARTGVALRAEALGVVEELVAQVLRLHAPAGEVQLLSPLADAAFEPHGERGALASSSLPCNACNVGRCSAACSF